MSIPEIPNKIALLELVKERLNASLWEAKNAMDAAQESANKEQKSSMGDKYETGRAMAQIDRDMYARRYHQLLQEVELLDRILENNLSSEVVKLGSLVETTLGWILLSISLGIIEQDGQKVMVVSTASPLGKAVLQKEKGEVFVFQGRRQTILGVH